MAILPLCPGLTVEVLVDGEPLSEYDDVSDTPALPGTVTKCVEAKWGVEFSIRLVFASPFSLDSDVGFDVYVDGQLVASRVALKQHLYCTEGRYISAAYSKKDSTWVKRNMCFAELAVCKSANGVSW